MNWWAILYAVVGVSVAIHFAIRLVIPEPQATLQAERRALQPIIILKQPEEPTRFQFMPRQ